jgi:hypothetical protein
MVKTLVRSIVLALFLTSTIFLAACSPGSGGPAPAIDFTWQSSAQNDIVFDATQLVGGAEITSFHWDFGDGTSATTAADVTHHKYAAAGNYTVTLRGADGQGHTYTATHDVASAQ